MARRGPLLDPPYAAAAGLRTSEEASCQSQLRSMSESALTNSGSGPEVPKDGRTSSGIEPRKNCRKPRNCGKSFGVWANRFGRFAGGDGSPADSAVATGCFQRHSRMGSKSPVTPRILNKPTVSAIAPDGRLVTQQVSCHASRVLESHSETIAKSCLRSMTTGSTELLHSCCSQM